MKIILIGLTFLCLTCCQSKENTGNPDPTKKVIISEYSISDSLRYSNEFTLEKTASNDKFEYTYREVGLPDSLINYSVAHLKQSDSLIYFGELFAITNTKDISVNNNSYRILKYSIDSDIADNDENIFLIEDYGLLIIRSIDWGNYSTFNSGQRDIILIIDMLKRDKTGFFENHIKKAAPNNGEQSCRTS